MHRAYEPHGAATTKRASRWLTYVENRFDLALVANNEDEKISGCGNGGCVWRCSATFCGKTSKRAGVAIIADWRVPVLDEDAPDRATHGPEANNPDGRHRIAIAVGGKLASLCTVRGVETNFGV